MIDPTPNEETAMAAGGAEAGAYLESLGKSDLAQLTPEEWRQFIEVIVTEYGDTLRRLAARDGERLKLMADQVPF